MEGIEGAKMNSKGFWPPQSPALPSVPNKPLRDLYVLFTLYSMNGISYPVELTT
jgi:hypothetical protein